MRLVIVITLVASFVMPRSADACDCPVPPSTPDAFGNAAIVAVVRVTRYDQEARSGSDWVGLGSRHYTLQVERAWKGAKAGDVIEIHRESGMSDCEYQLELNTTHLLYLTRHNNMLDASAPHCTRNQPVARADAEIAALEQLKGTAFGDSAEGASATEPMLGPKKPRGCASCSTSGDPSWLALLALAFVAARRRVRQSDWP